MLPTIKCVNRHANMTAPALHMSRMLLLINFVINLLKGLTTPAKFCSTNWRCSRTVLEHLILF